MKTAFRLIPTLLLMLCAGSLWADDFDQMRSVQTVAAAEALLKKGVSLQSKSSGGWNWLHLAANNGNVELSKFLIEKGLDVNARTGEEQQTPLMLALNFPKEVEFLISKGADINALDRYKKTIMHSLAYQGLRNTDEVIEIFLKKGARLDIQDEGGSYAMEGACGTGKVERVKMMLTVGKFPMQAGDRFNKTLLHNCAAHENPAMIQLLISKGARVDARASNGQTPLAYIIRITGSGNKVAAIQALLQGKSDPNAQDNEGNTSLHEAVIGGSPEVVSALLAGKADPDIANRKGVTPLQQAVINANYPVVKPLLKATKKLNALDKYGVTMLHDAVVNHKVEMIKLLLAAGADRSTKNKFGKTALETARYDNVPEIVQLLEEGGGQ
ncbi:MAG: ankyrin repeat domain-containing protein [Spirochaetia bacterium]|nr:ankyrin repeat domain-containing protein [Spirochaetia bacterium]